jgi:putative inorganic carbon (hco3(-)) transporter
LVAWLLDGRGLALTAAALAAAVGFIAARNPMLALGALVAVVLGLLVVVATEKVLLVLLAALPWEGLLHYPTATLSLVKILGALLLVSYLIKVLRGEERLRSAPASWAVGAFMLLVTLSFILSPDPGAGTATLFRYYLFGGFFFLMIQLVQDEAGVMRVLRVLTLSITLAAIVGLIPFLNGQTERVAGPITDPNDFGYLMATTLPLIAYLVITDRGWRPVWATCFPIVLAGVLATLSRGALVALGALLVWGLVTRRIKIGGLIVPTVALVAVALAAVLLWSPVINERIEQRGKSTESNTTSREALWSGAIAMSMDHPITGVGPGRFGIESLNYVQDNPVVLQDPVTHDTYLNILAENGPFALAAFIAFLAASWTTLSRCRRRCEDAEDPAGMRLATAVQAALLVAIVGAFFLSEQLASPFWLLGALAVIVPPVAARNEARFVPARAPKADVRSTGLLQPG